MTPRQRNLLSRIAQGQTSKQIAKDLGVAPRAIENRRARLYVVLGVSNAIEAVAQFHCPRCFINQQKLEKLLEEFNDPA